MTGLQIALIAIGVIIMLGSFFVNEKLSQHDMGEISALSTSEIQRILEKNMESASIQVEGLIDDIIDKDMEIAERALSKETNIKIQAIHAYSDTVMGEIQKTHNEVLFLYSMLNDKHEELTGQAGKVELLKKQMLQLEEKMTATLVDYEEMLGNLNQRSKQMIVSTGNGPLEEGNSEPGEAQEKPPSQKQNILMMHRQGMSTMEIAKNLGIGQGEVKLVVDLYQIEESI